MGTERYQIGDVVEATDYIVRKDGMTELNKGDRATIFRLWENPKNGIQIIALEVDDSLPICDIVCLPGVPLKLVQRREEDCSNCTAGPDCTAAHEGKGCPVIERREEKDDTR
jgi:hypothetical protein